MILNSSNLRLHILQHEDISLPGLVVDWARERGIAPTWTHFGRGDSLPTFDKFDLLVVLGGVMNCDDEPAHPWLREEKVWLRAAVNADKSVLGLCLGAQLLAEVLGGRAFRAPEREIGWTKITRTSQAATAPVFAWLPTETRVMNWHGDTFSLPPNAIVGASGPVCENQAFAWGERVLALQFHLEADARIVQNWIGDAAELAPRRLPSGAYESCVAAPHEMLPRQNEFAGQRVMLFAALDLLAARAVSLSPEPVFAKD